MDDRITNRNPLSLSNVGRGEVIRRFDTAMTEALENIVNPSTPAKKPRKIIIEINILPTEKRNAAEISIQITPKLPACEPYASHVLFTQDQLGNLIVHESILTSEHDRSELEFESI